MIEFIGYSQVITTINYNTLKNTVTTTHKNKVFNDVRQMNLEVSSFSNSRNGSLELPLAVWISDWANVMHTEYRSQDGKVDCPVILSSVATKHVSISEQRFDLYKPICCHENVFLLAVV
jgi:hypothetical protein